MAKITFSEVQQFFINRYHLNAAEAAENAKDFLHDYYPRKFKTIEELGSLCDRFEKWKDG